MLPVAPSEKTSPSKRTMYYLKCKTVFLRHLLLFGNTQDNQAVSAAAPAANLTSPYRRPYAHTHPSNLLAPPAYKRQTALHSLTCNCKLRFPIPALALRFFIPALAAEAANGAGRPGCLCAVAAAAPRAARHQGERISHLPHAFPFDSGGYLTSSSASVSEAVTTTACS